MTNSNLLENIILHENAYFFSKDFNGYLTKRLIKQTFDEASKDKHGNFLLNIIKEEKPLSNGSKLFYSVAIFKYVKKPSFIDTLITGWEETKLAYIAIIDFEEYVVLARRNISKINSILDILDPLDYEMMTSIFAEDDSSFEKLSMDNMNISDRAIRQKSLESVDLKENVSTFGIQGYILNNVRISNENQKVALALNSSRINQLGPKNDFNGFIQWAHLVVERIKNSVPKVTFLSSFATSIDYSQFKDSLTPTSILITLSKIINEYEENKIKKCFLKINNTEIEIDLIEVLKRFELLLSIEITTEGYKIKNPVVNDLFLLLNNKSITLRSKKLLKVFIEFETGLTYPILSVINWNKSYIITFDEPEFIYCNRKLFRDNRLLGNIDSLLKVLKPFSELENVTTEKGSFNTTSTAFTQDSIFGFVEKKFMADYSFFVCDDLSKEWADHIGLSETSISFYHSKYKNSNFSASAFQDIVGQALKNLGNLSPSDNQWQLKENLWSNFYNNDGNTNISRVRKGQNSTAVIDYFKMIKNYPNINKQVFLVINFISKTALEDRLQRLKRNENFIEKNEVIQILWFISSLISSCYEANTEVYICCKP